MEQSFYQQVYSVVARIPRGTVTSYGQIARLLGRPRAARIVGCAMYNAPEGLPWHRVIKRTGELAPGDAFEWMGQQRALLEAEGVVFLPSGCVDMKRFFWDGGE